MRLVSYALRVTPEIVRPGVLVTFGEAPQQVTFVLDCTRVLEDRHGSVARQRASMIELLSAGVGALEDLHEAVQWAAGQGIATLQATDPPLAYDRSLVKLQAPVPRPPALRIFPSGSTDRAIPTDGRDSANDVPAPRLFRFGNATGVVGPDAVLEVPESDELDVEGAIACIIGCGGRNILPGDALNHVAGLTLAGGWVARDLEREEQAAGIGPGKSRDFAISLGPWLVTLDELAPGRPVDIIDIRLVVNGETRASVRTGRLRWLIEEAVAHASKLANVCTGDVIVLGPEASLTGLAEPADARRLRAGDCVELMVDGLGTLRSWVGFRPGREAPGPAGAGARSNR